MGAGRSRGGRRARDAGMVTAELAAVLPAIVLVLAVALNAVAIGIDQIRCVDAARTAVREAARGESVSSATAAGRRAAPDGARIILRVEAGRVRSSVRAHVPGPFGWLVDGRALGADAVGRMEQP